MSLTFASFVDSYDAHYGDTSRGAFTKAKILEYTNSEVRLLRVLFDLPTSEYITQIPVWNDVFTYAIPAGYKGFISLQENFYIADDTDFNLVLTNQFWADVSGRNIVAEQWQGTARSLLIRLRYPQLANVSMNTMDSFNGNGDWMAFGDASNVHTNAQYFHNGSGSVAFDLTYATGTGGIYTNNMLAIDLSSVNLENVATLFTWSLFPSFTGFTSATFQWGSSATDYYEQTATQSIGAVPFVAGWQQLGYAWSTAVTHGTPNNTNVTFMRYTLNFPSTMPPQYGVSLDDIWMRQQILMNLTFTSEYLVTDVTGGLHEEFANFSTSSDWTLNIPPEFKDWIVFRVMERAFTFVKPVALNLAELKSNVQRIETELVTAYPSRRTLPTDNYYMQFPENPVPDSEMGNHFPWGSNSSSNPANW